MWFLFAVISYFLFSLVVMLDKYFLDNPVSNPKIYLFYTSVSSVVFLVFIPFGFYVPNAGVIFLNFVTAGFFVLSLLALYYSFKLDEASKIISSVGGLTAAFIYFFNYFVFNKKYFFWNLEFSAGNGAVANSFKILGILFLIFGSVFILVNFTRDRNYNPISAGKKKFRAFIDLKTFLTVILASAFSAAFFILIKFVYIFQPFISGFIWVKIGIILFGFLFLFFRDVRNGFFRSLRSLCYEKRKSFSASIIFINKIILGGVANIFQNAAVALAPFGNIGFIKSLEGTEYVFVLFTAYIFSKKYPKILKERTEPEILVQKIISVLIITCGILLLNI